MYGDLRIQLLIPSERMEWFIHGKLLAENPKTPTSTSQLINAKLEEHRIQQCHGCGHKIEREKVFGDCPGLPSGVKFDPTDQQLIQHLQGKIGVENSTPHPLLDRFITTLEGEDGICYTHPEKLPGVSREGSIKHFFHRPSKAYTTGTRKRRKIQADSDHDKEGETRWHKTGKTRPVMVNGKHKGCKKILVLYRNFGKNKKPEKTNWVMHQYHLGSQEEEKEGELVVSKVFYQRQPRQCHFEKVADIGDGKAGAQSIDRKEHKGSETSECIPLWHPVNAEVGLRLNKENQLVQVSDHAAILHPNIIKENWSCELEEPKKGYVGLDEYHVTRLLQCHETRIEGISNANLLSYSTQELNDVAEALGLSLNDQEGPAQKFDKPLEDIFLYPPHQLQKTLANSQESDWLEYPFCPDSHNGGSHYGGLI